MYNLSDESVVQHWSENPYYQHFSGAESFSWELPCDSTDLVYFRRRIGESGVEQILKMSMEIHGKLSREKEVLIDTTVQEKNITFPTDTKLYKKICDKCVKIARTEGIKVRPTYTRTTKRLILAQRFRNHPKNKKRAIAAHRKLKTIAGRLVRELRVVLSEELQKKYDKELQIFEHILSQRQKSKNKIYSIHEPDVYCISKGKEHKKYEFGNKVSITRTKNSGIIVGANSFPKNKYDGHTALEALNQTEHLLGKRPAVAIGDRGYRGKKFIGTTLMLTPKPPLKNATAYDRRKAIERFRKRAGIEPIIGHLKSDHS